MIYLAGPYTSGDLETHRHNIGRLFCYYVYLQKLEDYRLEPIICPPLESAGFDICVDLTYCQDWIQKCLELVKISRKICFTPEWTFSYGCNCELNVAESFKLEREFLPFPDGNFRANIERNLMALLDVNPFAFWALNYLNRATVPKAG